MKIILSLLAICSSACVSVSQQGGKDQSINSDIVPSSIDTRLKEAKKPFTYLRADKMKVIDGMEKDYLEIEKQWKEIHEKLMSEGKRLSWSVWKPKDNNLGYDYVTVQTFDSLDSMDAPFDWKEIGQSIGADKLESILNKTPKTRENVGSEIWKLDGWTELTGKKLPDSLGIGFMTPTKGKDSEYAELEKKYFSKFWQGVADVDESILGWQFARLLFSNGKKVDYKYYTLHAKDSSKKSISQKKRNEIWEKVNSDFPSDVKMNELRQMRGVEYELVFRADPSVSAINQEWEKLKGSWKHTFEDGSYRIKRISPYKEVLEVYSKDGVKKNQNESPLKIEIKNGLKYFYSIHPNSTWRSIYNIKDGKWYEQLRGIFGETNANPNDFLIYERID